MTSQSEKHEFELCSERVRLTELETCDAAFIYELFNDPECIKFIGDRGIKNLTKAETYLKNKLIKSYLENSYGLYKVTSKESFEPMGICGLVKRDEVNPPDVGFAFLPQFRSGGYCTEAAGAVVNWATNVQGFKEILAYTSPKNSASIRVLEKIGLTKLHITTLPGQDFESLVMSIKN